MRILAVMLFSIVLLAFVNVSFIKKTDPQEALRISEASEAGSNEPNSPTPIVKASSEPSIHEQSSLERHSQTPTSVHTDHADHAHAHSNMPRPLSSFPQELQQQVHELSGRAQLTPELETIVTKNGHTAVLMKQSPRVVPVAVINEDGEVEIYEF